MKNILIDVDVKKVLMILGMSVFLVSCNEKYIDDPDNSSEVPTSKLMNYIQYSMAYDFENAWTGARGTLGFAQYWAETEYTDENRYKLRPTQSESFWNDPYKSASRIKRIIDLNVDEKTKVKVAVVDGANVNQIQVARILLAVCFAKLVDTFGDIPYWSYGQKNNADFQALSLNERPNLLTPKYTEAVIIYQDLLKELLDAANSIDISSPAAFKKKGDKIYGGDMTKWIKFAHSLRLRLAVHIKGQNPTLAQTVFTESSAKAFTSFEDSAKYTFEKDDATSGPWHRAFTVGKRRDFAPTFNFVELLKNNIGPANSLNNEDPRLIKYFEPRKYSPGNNLDPIDTPTIVGLPYGLGDQATRDVMLESIPHSSIIKPDYTYYFMDFAEVEFIRSEFKNWDATHYKGGVKASMKRWGVSDTDADAYINLLPVANQANVLTQKYIALYMNGMEAWTEYRRTGFPTTLWKPGNTYSYTYLKEDGKGNLVTESVANKGFAPLVSLNDIPARVYYPQQEQLLNGANRDIAVGRLEGGKDVMGAKLFWDIN